MRKLLFFISVLISTVVLGQQVTSVDTNKVDAKGNKQGYWRKKEEGILKYEGTFKDNIPVDTFKYYYPDGKIKAVSKFYDKGNRSKTILYHPSGKIMAKGIYVNNKKDSLWTYYNEDGILISQEIYKNDKKNGVFKTFYPNGKVSEEIPWQDDVKQGTWKQYFDNGDIKLEATYEKGLLQGVFKYYYPANILRITGKYVNSLREGMWLYFKDTRETIKNEMYKNGKLIDKKVFIKEPKEDLNKLKQPPERNDPNWEIKEY